jgi:hypothetical protein
MVIGKRELSVVLLVFGAVISVYMALLAGPISAQNDCDEVASIGPETTNQRVGPVQINGNNVRVEGEVTSDDPFFSDLTITVEGEEEDGFSVFEFISITEEGPFEENILVGPGDFTFDIESTEGVTYIVDIFDCGETQEGGNGNTVSDGEPTIIDEILEDDDDLQEDVIIDNNKREPTVINIPNKPLPPTGGLPVYGMIAGFILAGASLLGLGVGIRRGQRR